MSRSGDEIMPLGSEVGRETREVSFHPSERADEKYSDLTSLTGQLSEPRNRHCIMSHTCWRNNASWKQSLGRNHRGVVPTISKILQQGPSLRQYPGLLHELLFCLLLSIAICTVIEPYFPRLISFLYLPKQYLLGIGRFLPVTGRLSVCARLVTADVNGLSMLLITDLYHLVIHYVNVSDTGLINITIMKELRNRELFAGFLPA